MDLITFVQSFSFLSIGVCRNLCFDRMSCLNLLNLNLGCSLPYDYRLASNIAQLVFGFDSHNIRFYIRIVTQI